MGAAFREMIVETEERYESMGAIIGRSGGSRVDK